MRHLFENGAFFNVRNSSMWGAAAVCFTLVTIVLTYFSLSPDEVETGVVRVVVNKQNGVGLGTGFKVAEPGVIVTNHHVIKGGESVQIAYIDDDKPESIQARILWYSTDKDLAILSTLGKLPGRVLQLADIDKKELSKTDQVTAVGFPGVADKIAVSFEKGLFDQDSRARTFLDPTVSSGRIQRLVPSLQHLTIQHSANINKGNSGGPLFDACQRVIGVNTWTASSTVNASDIINAVKRSGKARVESPGDLEFAVHIREVLQGLREKHISYSQTPGRCRNGVDVFEASALGVSGALALGSMLMFGLQRHRRPYGRSRIEAGYSSSEFEAIDSPATEAVRPAANGSKPVLKGKANGEEIPLAGLATDPAGGGILIGRSAQIAQAVINDSSISRKHARITQSGNAFLIEDCGSTNGTRVNGQMLGSSQSVTLRNGDVVRLGDVEFQFSDGDDKISQPGSAAGTDRWLLSGFDLQGNTVQHTLIGAAAAEDGKALNPICTVGRSDDCDLVIDDDAVSRRHAIIGIDRYGQLAVVDLGSSNGSFVDAVAVGAKPVAIRKSQKITFGKTELSISKLT